MKSSEIIQRKYMPTFQTTVVKTFCKMECIGWNSTTPIPTKQKSQREVSHFKRPQKCLHIKYDKIIKVPGGAPTHTGVTNELVQVYYHANGDYVRTCWGYSAILHVWSFDAVCCPCYHGCPELGDASTKWTFVFLGHLVLQAALLQEYIGANA